MQDPTDRSSSPPRSRPVRPDILDAAGDVDERPFPCPTCRYDLRGKPNAIRCPECGSAIPRRPRPPRDRRELLLVREQTSAAWRGLAVPALAPIVLMTPFPYLLPMGPAIAIAAGFAPGFRMLTLRGLVGLPADIRARFDRDLATLRALQVAELAFVGVVVLYAILWTVALTFPFMQSLYNALLVAWWAVSLQSVSTQLRVGHELSGALTDPAELPAAHVDKARRALLLAQIVGGAGALAAMIANLVLANLAIPAAAMLTDTILPSGATLLGIAGAVLGGYGCIVARGHAALVGECIFESEAMRAADRARQRAHESEDDAGQPNVDAVLPLEDEREELRRAFADAAPRAKRPPEDDAPIPLA